MVTTAPCFRSLAIVNFSEMRQKKLFVLVFGALQMFTYLLSLLCLFDTIKNLHLQTDRKTVSLI